MVLPASCIASHEVNTLKHISHTIRETLAAENWIVPGKKRFLDIVAMGLGYKSFSDLTIQAHGIQPVFPGKSLEQKIRENNYPKAFLYTGKGLNCWWIRYLGGIEYIRN